MQIRIFALNLLLVFSTLGCKKPHPAPPLPTLVFAMVDSQGRNLITSPAAFKMTYIDLEGKPHTIQVDTKEYQQFYAVDSTAALPYTYIFQGSDPPIISGLSGVKTFYLETSGKTDTLYYDVKRDQASDQYEVLKTLFNGQPAELRVFPATGAPYYLFRRK